MVGLTGGIGAGKTVVATQLRELGAVLIESDQLARDVVAPGTPGLAQVVATFGADMLAADGSLDRKKLGRTVFGDEDARRRLEGIVHPLVRARTSELAAAAPPDAIVVNDVPLLAETGLAPTYHLVVVVEAAEAVRVSRLVRGRGMAEADAYARIRAQATDAQRMAVADVVLSNDGTLDEIRAAVSTLWTNRLVPYEENVRLRRPVWPTYAAVVPYDPTWPDQYARLAARIARAAGSALRSLDHVGSTAVPGLAAKDTVDIQLGVADIVAADEIADALAAAGFPRAPGEWWDNPRGTPEAPTTPKRVHGSADPARSVNLHVRVAGSPTWRYALLMRDFLRSDDGEADLAEYVELKRDLANRGITRADYADAKDPWFDTVLPRMEDWARQTNWRP
jgi:dephospho-CoA kinase